MRPLFQSGLRHKVPRGYWIFRRRYNQLMQKFRLSTPFWLGGLMAMALVACGEPEPDATDSTPTEELYAATITAFSADPTQVEVGQSVQLAWSAHAETCAVEPEPGLLGSVAGTVEVEPTVTTSQYVLVCVGSDAEPVTATVDVEVVSSDPDPDDETPGPGPEPDPAPFPVQVSGMLTYDSIAVASTGMNYAAVAQKPIRAARVQLVHRRTSAVVTETVSGSDGSYALSAMTSGQAILRVYAETLTPHINVEDNTVSNAQYVLDSSPFTVTHTVDLDLHAGSGWTGASYGAARAAAPFAILDAAYSAAQSFLAVRSPEFARLRINWSEDNRPSATYNTATGEISTSHWDGSELYILGKADVDTDEYDSHIIVHEWGHYFESMLGRSDSLGGSHSAGDWLDPAVAFGEGWGNALSAMVLYPDAVYADTYGVDQSSGFDIDMDDNVGEDPEPGWFSEASVQSILYDLFDPEVEAWDGLEFGLGPLYDVMVGAQKSTPARTTIFSFIDGLRQAYPSDSTAINALTSQHSITPVADAWGTGETHNGGFAANLPVYASVVVDGAAAVVDFLASSDPGTDYNKLTSVRNLRFTGNGSSVTVQSTSAVDVDLTVSRDGVTLADAATYSGNETLEGIATQNGATYIITVIGYGDAALLSPDSYSASIEVFVP